MTWLYVLEAVVVVAAFMGMLWLRRESDYAWALLRFPVRYVLGYPPETDTAWSLSPGAVWQIPIPDPQITIRLIVNTHAFVAGMREADAAVKRLRRALDDNSEDNDL